MTASSLCDGAVLLLGTADPWKKCEGARVLTQWWRAEADAPVGAAQPPDRPARPEHPVLAPPNAMPRRSYGGERGRAALIHALAHIELNAVDLALDILCRFAHHQPPRDFYDDWIGVAGDEARHFLLLDGLLGTLGARYGDLPAHDGLWQAAEKTTDDILDRLCMVPLALEARALDVTPATIAKLTRGGDQLSPQVLTEIYDDEITHVAKGAKWFRYFSHLRGFDPATHYRTLAHRHFPSGLKPPFNHEARAAAAFPQEWYEGKM